MSGLDVRQVGELVVRSTLAALAVAAPGIDGPVAEVLLLATAAQESQFRHLHQLGGPALGLWQMEPATERDLWRWLEADAHRSLRVECRYLLPPPRPEALPYPRPDCLATSLAYACAMARLAYWRDPEALPEIELAGDSFTKAAIPYKLWPTYKRVWNTEKGAATEEEFNRNYLELVAPHWPPPA